MPWLGMINHQSLGISVHVLYIVNTVIYYNNGISKPYIYKLYVKSCFGKKQS